MEFRRIQYFMCLYEEGSVTRAARRLNVVQPALSMQIGKLEDEVGRKLFTRGPRGMQATGDAHEMYRLFLPVLADFSQARAQMLQSNGELSGPVRVGMIATIAQGVMVDALLEFTTAHPKVALSLVDGYTGGLIDAVAAGRLDAAVINKPRQPIPLASEAIDQEDLLLVVGAGHARLPASVRFRLLTTLKLVLPTRQHGLRGIIESFAQVEGIDLAPRVEVDSISAIVRLVMESDFATLLPRVAVRAQIADGTLTAHDVTAPRLVRHLVCVTHSHRTPSPATAAFLALLVRRVRENARARTRTTRRR